MLLRWICALGLAAASTAFAAPDEELLGKADHYPVGNRANWFYDERVRVGSFSHLDAIMPHHVLARSDAPWAFDRGTLPPDFHYNFHGRSYSIDDYLDRQRVTGLLIAKDGRVLVERYQYDRTASDKLVSHSMAKSLTSLAVGFALDEGKIKSLDDTVARYVPDLAGYAYGETSLRNLLRMSSGVGFSEEYNGKDDVARYASLLGRIGTIATLKQWNDRISAQGARFHYASIETQVLAAAVHAATGSTLAQYLDQKLWKPMGAEADATWAIGSDGLERAAGNFSATLRDWGRLGMLLANDGRRGDHQIVPRDYLVEATDRHRHPDTFAPGIATAAYGYGYQFWIFPGERRRFALLGVYGQAIFVDPNQKLVLVQTAVAKNARISREPMAHELKAMFSALVNQYEAGK